jgi:hypothetical protein
VGDRLQIKPAAGDTVDARPTLPLKPRSASRVLVGLAETVKSWTVKLTVCEWDSVPSVPLTVTV